jgi:hypothetical protein
MSVHLTSEEVQRAILYFPPVLRAVLAGRVQRARVRSYLGNLIALDVDTDYANYVFDIGIRIRGEPCLVAVGEYPKDPFITAKMILRYFMSNKRRQLLYEVTHLRYIELIDK